jgi:hypothetical protein
MLNPITVQMLVKTHQREPWKQAEVRRICREAEASQAPQPNQPGVVEPVAARVLTLVTRVSHRLTESRALPG